MFKISRLFQPFLVALLAFILLSIPLLSGRDRPAPVNAQSTAACDQNRSVSVNGAATVMVTPDRVLIQMGVLSSAAGIEAVQTANAASMQKVIKALTVHGIENKDISTDIYVIEPVYENYDSLYIKGYRINNQVAVTLRDISKTGDVIAAALAAGANQVQNVEFYSSSLRTYRDQARELAMKAAREKADALARTAASQIGCVLTISENSSSYYNGWWSGRSQTLWAQNTIQNAQAPAANPAIEDGPLSLGQIAIRAEVTVSYAIKQ
ncbi:MAG: SIMPL domain-containing protein [Anaerolineae bacterium]|nr:SIMPL domain-containing protein [Anaerolineae bacterium]